MTDSMFQLVKALTEIPGPIGRETEVQSWLRARWEVWSEEVTADRVGNLLARVGGQGPRILLGGHADEICFMVKSISPEGFVFLSTHTADRVGYIPKGTFPVGQPALILGRYGNVEGVFASITGHVMAPHLRKADRERMEWNDLFIDAWVESREELEARGVHPGCRVIWNPKTIRSGKFILGKAMDNRASLAVLTALGEALSEEELAYEVYFASTVQEEIGLVGASAVGREIEFDLGIAIDIGLCGDVPGVDAIDLPTRLDAGPILVYKDSTVHYDYLLTERLIEVAEKNEIPFQRAVFRSYGSDGEKFLRRGIPTSLVAFPTRYTHSPFETVHENDLMYTVELLRAFLVRSPEQT